MNFFKTARLGLAVAAILSVWTMQSFAQEEAAAGGTGGDTVGSNPVTIDLGEANTEVFEGIQRGGAVGSSSGTAVGSTATTGTNNTGGGFGGGGFGGGGFGGLGGLGALFGGGGFGNAQSTQPTIRTRLRSAIDVAPFEPAEVQVIANRRVSRLPARAGMRNINVSMVGRTAVISGTVGTDRERRMSELLMRLEPGVSQVQNNVVVSPTTTQLNPVVSP